MSSLNLTTSNFNIKLNSDGDMYVVEVANLSERKQKIIHDALTKKYGDIFGDYYQHPHMHRPWGAWFEVPVEDDLDDENKPSEVFDVMVEIFSTLKFDGFKYKSTNKKKAILELVLFRLCSGRKSTSGYRLGRDLTKDAIMPILKSKKGYGRLSLLTVKLKSLGGMKKNYAEEIAKLLLS